MATNLLPSGPNLPNVGTADAVNGHGVHNDILYEVIDGQIVELPPMGAFEVDIASILFGHLNHFTHSNKVGRIEAEMMFLLDAVRDLKRRPDIAFVSYARWPRKKRVPYLDAWHVTPELAVEVVSPTNTAQEIIVKVQDYFQAGCKRVWVVYPRQQQVYVYQSPTQNVILTRDDELDGEDILPGFRLPIASLFEADED